MQAYDHGWSSDLHEEAGGVPTEGSWAWRSDQSGRRMQKKIRELQLETTNAQPVPFREALLDMVKNHMGEVIRDTCADLKRDAPAAGGGGPSQPAGIGRLGAGKGGQGSPKGEGRGAKSKQARRRERNREELKRASGPRKVAEQVQPKE